MSGHTVEELRRDKRRLESLIERELAAFSDKYKVVVTDLRFSNAHTNSLAAPVNPLVLLEIQLL